MISEHLITRLPVSLSHHISRSIDYCLFLWVKGCQKSGLAPVLCAHNPWFYRLLWQQHLRQIQRVKCKSDFRTAPPPRVLQHHFSLFLRTSPPLAFPLLQDFLNLCHRFEARTCLTLLDSLAPSSSPYPPLPAFQSAIWQLRGLCAYHTQDMPQALFCYQQALRLTFTDIDLLACVAALRYRISPQKCTLPLVLRGVALAQQLDNSHLPAYLCLLRLTIRLYLAQQHLDSARLYLQKARSFRSSFRKAFPQHPDAVLRAPHFRNNPVPGAGFSKMGTHRT